ncbi:DEAD/DEAH box helicase [Salinirubrum litoreum]|uniref:Putative DNA 3'-5' helicase Rad25 n=1 Tax=Salinirubrum litoreum TaxID=1126234 RepID=A0ABD5R9A0_9EURY|nr:DEAD/DEAH box helicase [Salinirubrum litoreum]
MTADGGLPARLRRAVEDDDLGAFYDALEREGRPVVTAQQVARRLDRSQAEAEDLLAGLSDSGSVGSVDVSTDPVVWYPTEWGELATRERVILFPERREIIVDCPTQYTRAQLSQFATLDDTTGEREDGTRGFVYSIRREDIWQSPFEELGTLLASVRSVLPRRSPHLEGWIEDQWTRARQFTLWTHEDGYTVLEAASEDLMGNVARQKLDEEQLHAPISDTEAWVREGAEGEIKRVLYEAGYPVQDDRELDPGDPLDFELHLQLRDYQQDWVQRFVEQQSGVFVGPPGSGKTVAGMAAMAEIGGETLILVPSRELAEQWRDELLAHTTLDEEQVGVYHGGAKEVRPVTVATYQIASMDRHRSLFDSRGWGMILYDEVHHIPSPIYRLSADLQSKARLGLTATPVRGDDRETEIFTLVGPPIGTDWDKLFDAGYVAEPEVEVRLLPWADEESRNVWANAEGRERHQLAATNPRKIEEIRRLRDDHPEAKALIFVDWLKQGHDIAETLGLPFVSGETPHHERRRLFGEFRDGDRRTLIVSRVGDEGIDLPSAELAIVASGLGGSRRQGAQRAGRTMRPTGSALVYVLATRGTSEENFAERQTRHLSEKGVRVRERTVAEDDE